MSNLKNKPPVFVPADLWYGKDRLDGLSKAALADLVWTLAQRCAGSEETAEVYATIRAEAEIVATYRDDRLKLRAGAGR